MTINVSSEGAGEGFAATTITLRARQHWQAVDLGLALVREHSLMLYGSWLLLTFPIALLLAIGLHRWPFAVLAAFWWLKPLYERLPLLYLSKVVFGERLTPGALARLFVGSLRVQLFATLVWRRFSLARSMDQPIALLEGATGGRRRARLQVLHRQAGFYAAMLTVLLSNLEAALSFGNQIVIVMLLPGGLDKLTWAKLIQDNLGVWPYFLAVWMVGPVFAACGFSLYINRRCELEGWDIEVGFRRLAARLRNGALVLCCAAVGLSMLPADGYAAANNAGSASVVPSESTSALGHPRSSVAVLRADQPPQNVQSKSATAASSAAESRRLIARVLGSDKFHKLDSIRTPAFLEDLFHDPDKEVNTEIPQWLRGLLRNFVDVVWWVAWAVVISLIAWLAFRYRYWLAELVGRRPPPRDVEIPLGGVVAGVQLSAANIVLDSADKANALWVNGEARAATAMLLRLTLVSLVRHYGCVFAHGDTELDCTRRVSASQAPARAAFFRRLIDAWQDVAYAHRAPSAETFAALLSDYRGVITAPSAMAPAANTAAATS